MDAYHYLGAALYKQNKPDQAIAAFEKAIQLNPKNILVYEDLLYLSIIEKKIDQAIATLEKTIQLNPKYATTYSYLGEALKQQKKFNEAIAAYRKALMLPDDTLFTLTAHARSHNGLGLVYQRQGKLQEALQEYEAALEITPNYEYAKNNRNQVLALLKQPMELAYNNTSYLNPDDPLTHPKRSVVFFTPTFRQGDGGGATGFVIKRPGDKLWIVTNRHVVVESYYSTTQGVAESEDEIVPGSSESPFKSWQNHPVIKQRPTQQTCQSVKVELYLGDKPSNASVKTIESRVIHVAEDKDLDLAIIEIEASNLPSDIQALPISTPNKGMKITTIGHPKDNTWKSDEGEVIYIEEKKLILRISLAVGNSGSPVMEGNNGVVGIIYNIDEQGVGFAIPISQVIKQVESWGVKLP